MGKIPKRLKVETRHLVYLYRPIDNKTSPEELLKYLRRRSDVKEVIEGESCLSISENLPEGLRDGSYIRIAAQVYGPIKIQQLASFVSSNGWYVVPQRTNRIISPRRR